MHWKMPYNCQSIYDCSSVKRVWRTGALKLVFLFCSLGIEGAQAGHALHRIRYLKPCWVHYARWNIQLHRRLWLALALQIASSGDIAIEGDAGLDVVIVRVALWKLEVSSLDRVRSHHVLGQCTTSGLLLLVHTAVRLLHLLLKRLHKIVIQMLQVAASMIAASEEWTRLLLKDFLLLTTATALALLKGLVLRRGTVLLRGSGLTDVTGLNTTRRRSLTA